MLRNKELTGGEDISEDGVAWRSITSEPQLNHVINELAAQHDAMAFGEVDLMAPTDLPAPGFQRDLPDVRRSAPAKGAYSEQPAKTARSAPSRSDGADELDLGFEPAEEAASAPARPAFAPAGAQGQAEEALDLDRPAGSARGAHSEPPKKRVAAAALGADEPLPPPPTGDSLEVGDIPQLPPIWQTYRKAILAFAGVIALFLVGFFTHIMTNCGPFGLKCLSASLFQPKAPPVPAKPAAPPPKLADAKEIAHLIDEGSFEAFRSVFVTVDSLGPTLPDNMLAAAKARGFATLAFGPPEFPVEALAKAVEGLNTVDLTKTMSGNPTAAQNEILKARSALEIANGQNDAAAMHLAVALEQKADDKELAMLLGIARTRLKDEKGALEALDKAIVVDPKYAPGLTAIGDAVLSQGAKADAATWYGKALAAQPSHTISGIAAAKIYAELHQQGARRRTLATAAEKAGRGLPLDKQAPFVFEAAKAYLDVDQPERALPFAEEAARLEPGNVVFVSAHAIALAGAGRAKDGLALLAPILQRDPGQVDALLARARIYIKLEDVAKAFIDLDSAKKAAPKDQRIYLWEARFNTELAKLSDARATLTRLVKMEGASAEANVDLGRIDLSVGDADAAFKNATAAVAKDPNSSGAHALLGDCYLIRDELEKAQESYARALQLDDENVVASIGYANALRDMGAKSSKQRIKISEAVPIYLKALAANPKNPTVMFEYGRALELQGQVKAALELYREASVLDAKDVRPHLKMAAACIESEPPCLAMAGKSLQLAGQIEVGGGGVRTNGHVRFWEARLALLEHKIHDAEAAMRQAVGLEPRNALFHYWLGKILEENNSLYEAVGYYEKAISLNSRLAIAHRALGRTAIERNQYDKAREAFDKYREAAPEDHTIWVDVGESYTKQNREDQAMDAFQKAVKYDPSNAKALVQIGVILDHKGKQSEARKYFERAVKANADQGDAWCLLGLSLSSSAKGSLSKQAKEVLEKCISIKNASDDLKSTAREALETAGVRTN